jgi:putative nucleotidyltransferase with HDIG domain
MKQNKAILIFNRDDWELSLINAMLQAEDYAVFETSLPLEAIHILQKNDVDVVIANQEIEGMDSSEFKELAEKIKPSINIILLPTTPKGTPISDCKINLKELVQFIQNHIRTENRLIGESSRFKDFFFSFTDRLLQVFEVNDRYFFNNDHLVATLSKKVAEKMGLDEKLVDAIQTSALIRDIGKVGIQHQILDEKGRLGRDDLVTIKSHPLNTVQILKQVNFPWNVESIITHHHEHYDGNGYPKGLKGREIPLGSRIISIVDSFVAMTTDRPYRKARSREEALHEILKKAGTQFDPEVVEVFLSVIQEERFQIAEKKRILVLDKDEAESALIKLNISGDEFDVITAATTTEGIRYLKEKVPYLIIGDSETLGIDRFHFYNTVRQDDSTSTVPFIVMLPGKDHPVQITDPLVGFVVKPLNIDELSSKVKAISKKEPPRPQPRLPEEELKGVTGSLEDLSLVDIIQVLNMGLKTAKVILVRDKEKGVIYLKDGKIINVSTGGLTGHEAFFELMGWNKGGFKIFHGRRTDETNVTMDTMNLLLEASRVLDERRHRGNKR